MKKLLLSLIFFSGVYFAASAQNVGVGTLDPKSKLSVEGGVTIGSSSAGVSPLHGARRSLQFLSDNNYGGSFDNHTGYLIYATMPGNWGSATLNFAVSTNWQEYSTTNPTLSLSGFNVGIGTSTPSSKLSVTTDASAQLGGAAASSTFKTFSGLLGATAGSTIKLASIGFGSIFNDVSLGFEARRMNDGASWESTAMGLKYDVDATSPVNSAEIWLTALGNVGISTLNPLARLHVNGQGGGTIDFKTNGRIQTGDAGEAGGIWVDDPATRFFGAEGTENVGIFAGGWRFRVNRSSGNVGIGSDPAGATLSRLSVSRDNVGPCCGGENSTLSLGDVPANGRRASISFHNGGESEGAIELTQANTEIGTNGFTNRRIRFFDHQAQGLGIEISGNLWYGSQGSRTQTRDNVGLQGSDGSQSGFFETSNPINFYSGASNWQHLIDVRHSNPLNNFAMQIAGSFFDQAVWVRKTNNNPSEPWRRIVTNNGISNYEATQIVTGTSTVNMIAETNGFCFLTGQSGVYNGFGEVCLIDRAGGLWRLNATRNSGSGVKCWASCVNY